MTPSDLALELDLDRAESLLSTAWLVSPTATRLATRCSRSSEPTLRVRGMTLHRWTLAAFLGPCTGPRTLAGLAARHAALADLAARLNLTPRALATRIHGRIPDVRISDPDTQWGQVPIWNPAEPAENRESYPQEPVPSASGLVAALAKAHGLETAGIERREGEMSETVMVGAGHARMTIGAASDALAALAVEMHEAGHALYRAQQAGMSVFAAAPPARWFDEAIAAWAVRVIEDERFVADAGVRAEAAARRRKREEVTERLAGFEEEMLGGSEGIKVDVMQATGTLGPSRPMAIEARSGASGMSGASESPGSRVTIEEAWARTGLRDPAVYPALFDEPGVMASYVAADRARLDPKAGELRAWARQGAALDAEAVLASMIER